MCGDGVFGVAVTDRSRDERCWYDHYFVCEITHLARVHWNTPVIVNLDSMCDEPVLMPLLRRVQMVVDPRPSRPQSTSTHHIACIASGREPTRTRPHLSLPPGPCRGLIPCHVVVWRVLAND